MLTKKQNISIINYVKDKSFIHCKSGMYEKPSKQYGGKKHD